MIKFFGGMGSSPPGYAYGRHCFDLTFTVKKLTNKILASVMTYS